MVFPQRGEENLLRRTTSCKNFQPNMFNKVKCQNCFRTREAHDLDGDAANKKPKKVILCGYLFVAPGLDPENPASRSRKWQRRFFVIYETGELCYQLDDNPSTAPQGTVNMYTCTEVFNAKNSIGHDHSMGVVTPEGTLFIKAETSEEKNSWFIVLSEYPRMNQEAEKYKKRKKKKEERDAGPSNIPVKKETSKEGSPTTSSDTKPTTTSLGRMSSFKENIQPPKETSPDSPTGSRPSGGRAMHLRQSDHLNFRRSRSLRANVRKSRESLDEEEDSQSNSDTEEKEEKKKTTGAPSGGKMRGFTRRHTSPIKHVDYPTPNVAKLRMADKRLPPPKSSEGSTDEENETLEKDSLVKSEYTETLHRNNNNVYKSDPKESITYLPKRKNSAGDSGGSGRSSRKTSLTDKSTTAALKQSEQSSESAVLTDEEIANLDVTKRGRMRLSKLHGDGENQSPSKRTIEKRRHAKERRGRHTMDGSIQLIPVLDSDKGLADNDQNEKRKLKRSNSDPSLADSEDAMQRQEIAEIFPELYHLKSGWLNLMGKTDDEWTKHWFVLKDNKLSYYKDSKDDISSLEGTLDLTGSVEAVDFSISRNYGFKIKMKTQDDLVLSAMTSVIRTKWVNALNKAIQTARSDSRRSSVDESVITQRIENVSESIPVKKDENLTQVDSNKMENEEGEPKLRAPSQRIRDRKSRKPSSRKEDFPKRESRLSSDSDVFFDAVQTQERKQPEGRCKSPETSIVDTQGGDINDVLEEAVDALKARLKVVEDENAALKVKNFQLMEGLEAIQKYPQENTAEVELLNQIEKLVKVRSKLEHEMDENKMQLKQMRNAADLTEQKNQELKEQVASVQEELRKKHDDYNNLQSRFEKLVLDLREMETERSATRTKRKEERDKTVDVIERLNERIDVLERENLEAKDELRQRVSEAEGLRERCEELERRLAVAQEEEELVIVEQEKKTEAAPPSTPGASEESRIPELKAQLEGVERENKSLLAQLQGANRGSQMLKDKLKAMEESASQESSSQEMQELRVEIGEKEDEIDELHKRLVVVEERTASAEGKSERLAQELARGQQNLKETEMTLTREQELRLKAEGMSKALGEERDTLAEKLTNYESRIRELNEVNSTREEEREKYLREIDGLKNALKLAEEVKGKLEAESERFRQEGEGYRKEIEAKEDVLSMLQGEMNRVKEEWNKFRREVERLKQENEDLFNRLDSANLESKAWRDKAETLELIEKQDVRTEAAAPSMAEVEQLREELVRERSCSDAALKTLEIEIVNKQEELKVVSSQAEDYQKQLQLLTDALKSKAEAVIQLQAEIARKDESISAAQEQIGGKTERLEKELKRLRGQLDTSQKDFDALEIQHKQLKEQQAQGEMNHSEEVKLMGQRIQDLTVKLSAAEKKVLASAKEAKGSKHKACKAREAESAARIEALEAQVQVLEKNLKVSAHKLLEATSREVELRKMYQAKCIEGSRHKEQNRSTQRDLIMLRKKVSNVDDVLREHETLHQQSLSEVKQSYAMKMRAMEESRRKQHEQDAEALSTALEAVKRVYNEQLQQELLVMQAGSTKDVDSMLRRHKDVVTHMNKDWVIMSSKFSELCRENARLTGTITGLEESLHKMQDSIKEMQETNQSKIDDFAASLKELKSSVAPENPSQESQGEDERLRMLNVTLKLREFELKCAQDEVKTLRTLEEASRATQPDSEEPDGAVGGSDHYLSSGLKVSAL